METNNFARIGLIVSHVVVAAILLGCTNSATATPGPTPDIDATVEARTQATIAAMATPPGTTATKEIATSTPAATPDPTAAPLPSPAPTTTPLTLQVPTPTPSSSPTPEPLPTPSPSPSSGGTLELEPTAENLPIIQLAKIDQDLAKRVNALPWVMDGITSEERLVLFTFLEFAADNRSVASEVAGFEFFTTSAESPDATALFALNQLSTNYPADLRLLTEQDWFKDGLSTNEAAFVHILRTHSILRTLQIFGQDDFNSLVITTYGEDATSKIITLPRAGKVQLIVFNRPTGTERIGVTLDIIESAITLIEEFMGVPFPDKQVLLLFTPTGDPGRNDVEIVALFVGSHMILKPGLGREDIERLGAHELAHYYISGEANVGLPPWFGEGGADFLASYVRDRRNTQSLTDRRRELTSNLGTVRWCKDKKGVSTIRELLDFAEQQGYYGHQESIQYFCNYAIGEVLFLDLLEVMGDQPFRTAWQNIYLLSESVDRLVSEEEIYNIFIQEAPSNRIDEFEQVYGRWHGGTFKGMSAGG